MNFLFHLCQSKKKIMSQIFTTSVPRETKNSTQIKALPTIDWKQLKFVMQSLISFALALGGVLFSIANDFMFIAEILPASVILLLIAFIRLAAGKN